MAPGRSFLRQPHGEDGSQPVKGVVLPVKIGENKKIWAWEKFC